MGGRLNRGKVHAAYNGNFETPDDWKRWVRSTMGVEDFFDPCPATWTPDQPSGLDIPWGASTYINHPGSPDGKAKHEWFAKLLEEIDAFRVRRAVWCMFSDEHLRTMPIMRTVKGAWFAQPSKRIAYIRKGVLATQPQQWSWFWLYNPHVLPVGEAPCTIYYTPADRCVVG